MTMSLFPLRHHQQVVLSRLHVNIHVDAFFVGIKPIDPAIVSFILIYKQNDSYPYVLIATNTLRVKPFVFLPNHH